MVDENTLLLCMTLAMVAGALLGFALGYGLKERKHSAEIESIIRIAKGVGAARFLRKEIERAPKGPAFLTQADWEREAAKPRRPAKWGAC
jgi:hypothetical protein